MSAKVEFLYLSEEDMVKAGVQDISGCIDVIDEVYKLIGQGDYLMGGINGNSHGEKLHFPKESKFKNMPLDGPDRRFMAMVAYLGGRFGICGEKWYGSNIENTKKGLPRSILMVILNDPMTGAPIAIMSANLISSMRTGASPAVAVRHLGDKNVKRLAAIGAGPISRACISSILTEAKSIREFVVFDLFEEKSKKLAEEMEEKFGVKGVVAESTEEAISDSDLISVAASRLKPVNIKSEWLKDGALILQTGGMTSDDEYWLNADIVLDNPLMHTTYMEDAKKTMDPESVYKEMMGGNIYSLIDKRKLPNLENFKTLGEIALKDDLYSRDGKKTTHFISGGQAVFDLGWSYEIYKRAKEKSIGQKLLLWDNPLGI
ncbi:tyramine oxidase subunit B [Peptoniphilus catoniae]|uniref:tyramine oxidase subunit B n=1 Tax=Peptoniphilus catoniae TaxID=1660341 RepID=UPI0010FE0C61|nr:tyramine oxidase subunit B [Peptoniphilus catoniae]